MGIELALMAVGGALLGGTISAATGGDFGKGMLMGALTGGIGVGITRAIDMTTGSGGGLLGKTDSQAPSSYASTPSAATASSTTKALAVSQLQAGNSNVSNTMGGYTSNTLNTARGRLLNL